MLAHAHVPLHPAHRTPATGPHGRIAVVIVGCLLCGTAIVTAAQLAAPIASLQLPGVHPDPRIGVVPSAPATPGAVLLRSPVLLRGR